MTQPDCRKAGGTAPLETALPTLNDKEFSSRRRALLVGLGMAGTGLLSACASSASDFKLDRQAHVSAQRLDQEAAKAYPLFNTASVLPGFDVRLLGARNDVVLYRLITSVTLPENGETLQVSGLLAVPAGARGVIPVVSWQHGTILSFNQVPSNLTRLSKQDHTLSDDDDSLETLLNVHRFAGNGYAVIAADYVGKGPLRHGRGEAYTVKDTSTATCLTMLYAGLSALRGLALTPGQLFLHGWSQGSLNTQWLHQALRQRGVQITASAVASPFSDLVLALSYWTERQTFDLPPGTISYPDIPAWVSLCIIVLLGSYQTSYGIDGLLESATRPEFHAMARKYWNDYKTDFDSTQPFPTTTTLLVPDFFESGTDPRNRHFLELLARNDASNWRYDSPIRFHVGLADEATHPEMTRRTLIRAGALAQGIPVAGGNHRTTFLAGLYGDATTLGGYENVLTWFNGMRQ